jgi:hypothetical protein
MIDTTITKVWPAFGLVFFGPYLLSGLTSLGVGADLIDALAIPPYTKGNYKSIRLVLPRSDFVRNNQKRMAAILGEKPHL